MKLTILVGKAATGKTTYINEHVRNGIDFAFDDVTNGRQSTVSHYPKHYFDSDLYRNTTIRSKLIDTLLVAKHVKTLVHDGLVATIQEKYVPDKTKQVVEPNVADVYVATAQESVADRIVYMVEELLGNEKRFVDIEIKHM